MTAAVEFERVSYAYPEGAPVLRDVTVAVPEGAFAVVVGPTGAGKSTLLRAVNGLVPHFSGGRFAGRVTAAGRDTRRMKPREMADAVAFVPQDPAASFVLDRVEDEIAYGMENLGISRARMRRRMEEILDLLALAPLRNRSVRTLSGGERQRVAIAAALAPGPRLLVLDEPTSQLDPQGAEDVLAALGRLVHDLGITVVAAEHRLERVAGFCDLAIGVTQGHASTGPAADVFARLGVGPAVGRLGRALGWDPPPLTVREARRRAVALPLASPTPPARSAAGAVLLAAHGLVAGYGGEPVLARVDAVLRKGEIVALMGRNGAGKSTLLRALAGLLRPLAGSVAGPCGPPRSGIDVALCPQEPEEVLFCPSVLEEMAATPGVEDPWAVLEEFGLADVAARHPRDLSAGQRLLVAAAAIVAAGAPVFLLDEPTRGLDPESKERLTSLWRAVAARGGAVMFATHDVELAAAAAARVLMLGGGEVVAAGPTEEILGDSPVFAPQMARVFGPGWLTPEQVLEAVRCDPG